MTDQNRLSQSEITNSASRSMVDVEVFDPPMCCSTGLCGPSVDQTLLDVNEMLTQLEKDGLHVARYQMTTHTAAFLNNPEVMRLVQEQQMAALPITVVRGKVIRAGSYPSLAAITSALNGAAE
jgi:hypothetical protein